MNLVVLGLKNKKDGSLHLYDTISRKNKHVPVKIGQSIPSCPVSPFPFSNFSSLDYDKSVFDTHSPTYLEVEADLSEDEFAQMSSGSIVTYQFPNRMLTVLSEYETPFEYALEQLTIHGKRLGTYDITTWVIHEESRTPKEFEAMCQILEISINEHAKTEYMLDLSLDRHVLNYLEFLIKFPKNAYTFGRYGHNSITKEDIQSVTLSDEALLMLLEKTYLTEVLVHHPHFDVTFYRDHIQTNQTLEQHVLDLLCNDKLKAFSAISFDMDYLFSRFYVYKIENGMPGYSEYDTMFDLVSDVNYKSIKKTYNPYEYYCCPDCDGYELDSEDEPYDYFVDEQVNWLSELIRDWDGYLSTRSTRLFNGWDKKIFERYKKEYPDSEFTTLLLAIS